jgi:peptidoglycan LD-endopeptidase LytH
VLASLPVAARDLKTITRVCALATLVAASAVPMLASTAAGEPSLDDLRNRMSTLQERLDATTARVESLRTREDESAQRIAEIGLRMDELEDRTRRLEVEAAQRADALYRDGGTAVLEVLFTSTDLSELTDRAQMMSEVSREDAAVFVTLSRTRLELGELGREVTAKRQELSRARRDLEASSERLQDQFEDVAGEYERLKKQIARAEARAEAEAAAAQSAPAPAAAAPELSVASSGGMACPVAGPFSFIDSWGAPRAGHTHQGVDMMAAYGTPVVAIVSGAITFAAFDGSGGNMIFLSGDDGNAYWYMHNQENLVTGGNVSVGQQIATVGDTGNAAGTPHLHFEYHPGGGAAVNPYPLVASIC